MKCLGDPQSKLECNLRGNLQYNLQSDQKGDQQGDPQGSGHRCSQDDPKKS